MKRVKLRSCIREGVFKYKLEMDQILWSALEYEFGKSTDLEGFNIKKIEHSDFNISFVMNSEEIVLTKKKGCRSQSLILFHEIIGYDE